MHGIEPTGQVDVQAGQERLAAAARAVPPGAYALVSVTDTGCGMSQETLRHLGEPFFSSKGARGLGLGLFLARTFAERIGGTLTAESREGGGSIFVLSVPRGAP